MLSTRQHDAAAGQARRVRRRRPDPRSFTVSVLLTALVAFGPLSTDLYLPALPTLVSVFDSDIATVQLTLSVFLIGFAVSQLIYGPVSDRFGRRPVMIGGVALFVVASIACLFAETIGELIAARFFQALGACCGPVLGRAVVRDVHGREQAAKMLAYMAMAMALAPAIGPMIGGHLTVVFGWRASFAILLGFGVVVLAGVIFLLPETNAHPDRDALKPLRLAGNYARLLTDRGYVGHVLCVACVYSGIFAFLSGSAFVFIDRIGLSPAQYGMSFGVIVVGYMIGTFAAGRLTTRIGIRRLIVAGTGLAVLGGTTGAGLALADIVTVWAILAPVFVFMIGAGLSMPNAMAGALAPFPAMAGLASALLGFVQMGVGAGVGILVGHLHDGTARPMMVAICLLALAAYLADRCLARRG